MPIPRKTEQEVLPSGPATGFQQIDASPEALSYPGRALAHAGAEIERGGEGVTKFLKKQQDQKNETAVEDVYSNDFSPKFRELYQKYYSLQGKDAVDGQGEITKQMQELRNETRAALPNQKQQMMFDSISRRRVEMELDAMARHSEQQNKVWQGETHSSTLKNYRTQAADKFNDERAFGTALGSAQAQIERYGMASGKSSEWMRAQMQTFTGEAAVDRVGRWMLQDPIGADTWYKANTGLFEPQQRAIIEHHLKGAVQPVEAKNMAASIISGSQVNPQKQGDVLIPVAATQESMATDQPAPLTMRDTRAQLASWISTAEQAADRSHPNDPVFRDLVVGQIKGYVSTIVAAQEGIARQAHGALMTAAMGSQGGPKPLVLDDLLSSPEARRAWSLTDPQSQRGILALLEHNAKEARGEFQKSNPKVVQDLFNKVHLPEGDPNQIKSATQLAPYFAKGLNRSDYDWLKKEIDENQKPEGNAFLKDVREIEGTARRMIMSKANLMMKPDVGEDAALRFSRDLRGKIDQYRAAGKDPRDLITPGKPDYVATPERVSTFMKDPAQAMREQAEAARRGAEAAAAPKPGAAPKETPKVPTVANDADFAKLKSGAEFIDPNGVKRRKP